MFACPSCSAENADESKFCSECGAALSPEYEPTQIPASSDSSQVSSSGTSSHHGRFLPGSKVADRYRIVSLLGKGGMGEVYRADDLKLGHTVALKFLPKDLADDPQRLEYFLSEVRLTRQISHPNVCRVYDIGEVEGQQFLSMEYIDGEDLRVLLRRIGRLPKDKGVQIAQQLCAGLAAAHQQGVLHRDLKPANIMIDGRGQVRITDFGLAKLAGEGTEGEIAGTPAYMAPEQLREGTATIQSDLYSLGLILYEVFTGKAVYKPGSIAELLKAHEESELSNPSQVIDDMDPLVERTILRCLEKNPAERPKSAQTVAAALPGGDPLAAALAAGETPSPEMVAAAGDSETVSPKMVGVCLVVVALGLALSSWMGQRTQMVNRLSLDKSTDFLKGKAQQMVIDLGYLKEDERPFDSAHGLLYDDTEWAEILNREKLPEGVDDRWELLEHTPVLNFWYRQSPGPFPMFVNDYWSREWGRQTFGRVSNFSPEWTPGMVGIVLGPGGELRRFRAVPPETTVDFDEDEQTDDSKSGLQWSQYFTKDMTGFEVELDDLDPATWRRTPPDAYDELQAWEGEWPDTNEKFYVEAAAYRGRPVYFEVLNKSEVLKESDIKPGKALSQRVDWQKQGTLWLQIVIMLGAVPLAWRNVRIGRCDRQGAFRLASFCFAVVFLQWVFLADHLSGSLEWPLMMIGLSMALFGTAQLWMLYIALEPFVRRIWPQTLTSWTRVLKGRWRDARIGSDMLLGVTSGVLSCLSISAGILGSIWLDLKTELLQPLTWLTRDGVEFVAQFLDSLRVALWVGLVLLTLLLILRIVLRSERRAAVASVFSFTVLNWWWASGDSLVVSWIVQLLNVSLIVWLLTRYGLFVVVIKTAVEVLLKHNPFTPDSESMFFTDGVLAIAVVVGLALYGAYHALAGRDLFRDSTLFAE